MANVFIRIGLALSLVLASCAGAGREVIHEGDHAMNYRRVFGTELPPEVEVANSVVFEYARSGTDDWEFEILANDQWIDTQVDRLQLSGPLETDGAVWRDQAAQRQKNAARSWFAPDPIDTYDVYILKTTSIPYVHAFVDRRKRTDGRSVVYLSKH